MEDKKKNEVGERRESNVLFEPVEPLFPDLVPRPRRFLPRIIALALFALTVAAVWAVVASGEDEGDILGSDEGYRESSPNESIYESEPSEETSEGEADGAESDRHENESMESGKDTKTDVGGEHESTEIIESASIKEVDLSQIEKGDKYIINYTSKTPDISGLIDRGFIDCEKTGEAAPVVMVIHTHTSETYLGGENSFFGGVASAGDVLVQRLNRLGLSTLHCTVIHDGDDKNAYLNARDTIKTMLEIYPSIKYIIDLHRLKLEADGEIIKTVSGSPDGSAQIRLTASAGSGDRWQENLSLALALKSSLNRGGEHVCMPAVLSQSTYNSDLAEYYIMVDIGSSGNAVDEAKAAAKRLADALADVLLEK
ncbi:MAG: stage II sporulation protein P [Eubacteriales bacterium]